MCPRHTRDKRVYDWFHNQVELKAGIYLTDRRYEETGKELKKKKKKGGRIGCVVL